MSLLRLADPCYHNRLGPQHFGPYKEVLHSSIVFTVAHTACVPRKVGLVMRTLLYLHAHACQAIRGA